MISLFTNDAQYYLTPTSSPLPVLIRFTTSIGSSHPWDELDGQTLMLKPQDTELVGDSLCDFVTLDNEDPQLEICASATAPETEAASKPSSDSSVKGLAGWALLSAAMMVMQLN